MSPEQYERAIAIRRAALAGAASVWIGVAIAVGVAIWRGWL